MKNNFWEKKNFFRYADLLSAAGILVFVIQVGINAHFQVPVLDEGLYLYKGFLFVTGRYQPFQDYGPLTNQMPFAFIIPGVVQFLFGPGLRVGRYFAILLSTLMILGLWLVSRRLTNPWLAAPTVWVFALIPAATRMYSMAISEGMIACLLVWVLVLTLGEKRRLWQLVLGSILAGLIVMIRINMLPLLPLLCLYILWQHGWKAAAWATLACALTVIISHMLYWPNILRLWAYWLPEKFFPFLRAWQPPSEASPFWDPIVPLNIRIDSFLEAVRLFFVPIFGALVAWVLWPQKSHWKSPAYYRMAVFLSLLFIALLGLHAWASLSQNYCVFCFPIYTSFFAGLGLLLVTITIISWQFQLSGWRQIFAGIVVFGFFLAVGYLRIPNYFIKNILKIQVPRIRSLHFIPGNAQLWQVISNKFNLDYEVQISISAVLIPVLFGLLCCGLSILIAWLIPRLNKHLPGNHSAGSSVLIFILLAGWILSPTIWFGNGYHRYDCTEDILAADERVGEALRKVIPPQAKIFWRGISPETLLQIPQTIIYPPQLNGDYSYRLGGEEDELLRYGWWNQALGLKWVEEADYILVAPKYYKSWLRDVLESGDYQEINLFPSIGELGDPNCQAEVYPLIFTKNP